MSELQPSPILQNGRSNLRIILFMVALSFTCALILSVLASALAAPKGVAKDLDRSKQLLIAVKILDHQGHFILPNSEGVYVPAEFSAGGKLIPAPEPIKATNSQLIQVYQKRVVPMLVDTTGTSFTFQEAHLNETEYLSNYKKTGYYKQPFKLVYKIMPNLSSEIVAAAQITPEAYVIPINGMGLWDAIYGYLAVAPNGTRVIGISWYDQKETPGLGANMAEASWQSLFPGKSLFQENAEGKIDLKTAPLGIVVVKGKVNEVLGNAPKAKSAVDGMTGATLTGNGITDAYKNVLNAYRPFLIKLYSASK